MNTDEYLWSHEFKKVHEAACGRFAEGRRGVDVVNDDEKAFLLSIGCRPYEFYDFIEDFHKYGEPDYGTVLLITAARRDYFLYMQDGEWIDERLPMDGLPRKPPRLPDFAGCRALLKKRR